MSVDVRNTLVLFVSAGGFRVHVGTSAKLSAGCWLIGNDNPMIRENNSPELPELKCINTLPSPPLLLFSIFQQHTLFRLNFRLQPLGKIATVIVSGTYILFIFTFTFF